MAKRTDGRSRQKHERWAREIARWRRSGESVRAFCRRRGLREPSFYYWRRRVEAEPLAGAVASAGLDASAASTPSAGSAASSAGAVSGAPRLAFAELRLTGERSQSAQVVELTLPSGEQLRIGGEVSGEHLQRVLTAVREVHGC